METGEKTVVKATARLARAETKVKAKEITATAKAGRLGGKDKYTPGQRKGGGKGDEGKGKHRANEEHAPYSKADAWSHSRSESWDNAGEYPWNQ